MNNRSNDHSSNKLGIFNCIISAHYFNDFSAYYKLNFFGQTRYNLSINNNLFSAGVRYDIPYYRDDIGYIEACLVVSPGLSKGKYRLKEQDHNVNMHKRYIMLYFALSYGHLFNESFSA